MSLAPPVFEVKVEGVGDFLFQRRTLRLQIAIDVEYARLTEGLTAATLGKDLEMFCNAVATLKVLAKEVPEGWTVDEADPYDVGTYSDIIRAWRALSEKEGSFRRGGKAEPPAAGAPAQ